MFHKPVSGLAGIALLLACAAVAESQDFHVSTRLYDLQAAPQAGKKDSRPPLRQHCESLFHAGKVYDYNDGSSQITIFEPPATLHDHRLGKTAIFVSFTHRPSLHQAQHDGRKLKKPEKAAGT